jgi:adenosylhomocysteine nucleosidase
MSFIAVTGLKAEAAIAEGAGIASVCGGGDRAATRAALARAKEAGATGLLSFGIAGALAPDLVPGSIVVADRVVGATARPLVLPIEGRRGAVLGTDSPIATGTEKASRFAATGALCVDLESDLVAAAGLPYAVVRAIADPAHRDLPSAALVGLRPDGTPDLAAVLREVAHAPGQIPALIRLALETRAALGALRRAIPRGGSAFHDAG